MKLHLKNVKLVIQLPYHLIKLCTKEEEQIKEQNFFMKCRPNINHLLMEGVYVATFGCGAVFYKIFF
jgi:hypothetical protein